ncbi:MAG: hypothetical protein IT436_12385 [Phycisphaerales bacterium]|nr:hypothetical protein [Phycisphaerales bacterium]
MRDALRSTSTFDLDPLTSRALARGDVYAALLLDRERTRRIRWVRDLFGGGCL